MGIPKGVRTGAQARSGELCGMLCPVLGQYVGAVSSSLAPGRKTITDRGGLFSDPQNPSLSSPLGSQYQWSRAGMGAGTCLFLAWANAWHSAWAGVNSPC